MSKIVNIIGALIVMSQMRDGKKSLSIFIMLLLNSMEKQMTFYAKKNDNDGEMIEIIQKTHQSKTLIFAVVHSDFFSDFGSAYVPSSIPYRLDNGEMIRFEVAESIR